MVKTNHDLAKVSLRVLQRNMKRKMEHERPVFAWKKDVPRVERCQNDAHFAWVRFKTFYINVTIRGALL